MPVSAVHTSAPTTTPRINWSPYLAGIGIGVLSWIIFVVNSPIGITTAISPSLRRRDPRKALAEIAEQR